MNRRIAIAIAIAATAVFILLATSSIPAIQFAIEWSGKRNTGYGSGYTREQFDKISIGMPANSVKSLIGDPVARTHHPDYPVWALREKSVREQLGIEAKLNMEVWSYSKPLNYRRDYELTEVAFGPEQKVIEKERWVTD